MRIYMSLIAVVVAISASQAFAAPADDRLAQPINGLSTIDETIVDKLSEDAYSAEETQAMLSRVEDKSVDFCNGKTIAEVLAAGESNLEKDCTAEALKQRDAFCDTLIIQVQQPTPDYERCYNARRNCRSVLENVAFDCVRQKKVADPKFAKELQTAVDDMSGKRLYYNYNHYFWTGSKSELENFIAGN